MPHIRASLLNCQEYWNVSLVKRDESLAILCLKLWQCVERHNVIMNAGFRFRGGEGKTRRTTRQHTNLTH